MKSFYRRIYWKLFLAFLASILLTASVMVLTYFIFAPEIEVHPHIKKSLIDETRSVAERITASLAASPSSLADVTRKIHVDENANIRVFDLSGRELVAWMDERLKGTRRISMTVIEETLRTGEHLSLIFPRWIQVVSMPLKRGREPVAILQIYYPLIEKSIFPQGVPTLILLFLLGGMTAFFSRWLTRPVQELTRGARRMSAGNFGAAVTIRSRDEIGELGKAFNEMSRRLAEFHKSLTELLADISHEIRSPLARIQTDAEILIDREMGKEEQAQHLQAICEEVRHIDHLIDDLLMLSRLENNQLTIERSRVAIGEVLSREVSRFLLQAEEKAITLKQVIAPGLPVVSIDEKRIGQVISNLLTNAIRYTPPNGTIEVGTKSSASEIQLWVSDTGAGITPEDLPYIFDRLYRVDKSRSRSTGGTGLGLAIARRFVEAHGGHIRAESEAGKGTVIIVTLPLS
ncbi:MAG: HAMP domain-containing sensor histidine kinase [Proteobacteria bacterium]|nr:HAMP domain-containing sensor histidine kinase [Pseudomonadota bacterium]